MIIHEEVREKLLKDPEVLKEYEAQKAEFEIARALIKARLKAHMTQVQVAERLQTSQSQIARMESGSYMPSVNSIYRYAQAVQQVIYVSFIP